MPRSAKRFSLAAVETNQEVVIEKVLFGDLADFCAALGIAVGSAVRCRAASPRRLYLSTPAGRTVALDRDRARFVQVTAQPRAGASDQRVFSLP